MKFITLNKKYYCGIDLHAKKSYVCIMNRNGKILVHTEVESRFEMMYELVKKYRTDIAICCESTFNWYWLSDGCRKKKLPFYLGHALYMKAIHGGKTKSDKIDSKKLANLLRTNHFPLAYDYPQKMRTTRDLLRRRRQLVCTRSKFLAHSMMYMYQHGKIDLEERTFHKKETRRNVLSVPFGDG